MSRNDLLAAAAGIILVLVLGAVAIAFATEEDDGGHGLAARVAALEERVEELEAQSGGGFPFRQDGLPRFLDEIDEDFLGQLFERFGGDFQFGDGFEFDPNFIEDLIGEDFLDGDQAQELREALEMLLRALAEARGG